MIHVRYLLEVLRHKWRVLIECRRLGIFWLGVVHDLSKFSRVEWKPCAENFCSEREYEERRLVEAFNYAWLYHQKRNKHHWQFWILVYDEDTPQCVCLPMPDRYRREMLANWRAFGPVREWYMENREKMQMHPETRRWIEKEIEDEYSSAD